MSSALLAFLWYISDSSYNDKTLYIIDVSQSVEHDHPRSLEFLRMDIKNITDYFSKKSVSTLSERKAFEFITSDSPLARQEMESRIDALMQQNDAELEKQNEDSKRLEEEGVGGQEEREGEREVEERVFRQAYIPRNLFEVVDPERDVGIIERGGKDDLIYAKFLNVQETKSQNTQGVLSQNSEESKVTEEANEETTESESDDEDTESEEDGMERPRGKRYEDKEAKKERKQKVKDEARERRKNKIPKAEKKRKIKVSKGKK